MEAEKLDLPGWDQPLTYYDTESEHQPPGIDIGSPFADDKIRSPDAFAQKAHPDGYSSVDDTQQWSQLRRTQLEIAMIHIMNAITDKPRWEGKIWDAKICEKWTREIEQQLAAADTRHAEQSRELRNGPFYWGAANDAKCARFIIDELKYRSERYEGLTGLLGLDGADIVKSDTSVTEEFRQDLENLLSRLEDGPEPPDWHPGRENTVRNLVHPSMYPLQFGKTKMWDEHDIPLQTAHTYAGHGKVINKPEDEVPPRYSVNYQWLPAEVCGSRGYAAFSSYINNLDVIHAELYQALGELVNCSLPLWDKCMATRRREDAPRRVPCHDEDKLWDVDPTNAAGGEDSNALPPYTQEDQHQQWHERYGQRESRRHDSPSDKRRHLAELGGNKWYSYQWDPVKPVLVWPEPMDFASWRAEMDKESELHPTPKANLDSHLSRRGLQVIVKIATIHLSPENPVFSGGAMHVEGMANEHICATSIYYLSSQNITTPQISFTGGAHMGPCHYHQSDFSCLQHIYGTSLYQAPATQHFITAKTPPGRLLAFPNVFQHRVLPFQLLDKTKPGHRKMIVLWLVNPQKRIISTAHVPPQQPWAFKQMAEQMEMEKGVEGMGPVMSEEEARDARLALMAERGQRDKTSTTTTAAGQARDEQRTYFFCEH